MVLSRANKIGEAAVYSASRTERKDQERITKEQNVMKKKREEKRRRNKDVKREKSNFRSPVAWALKPTHEP